MDEELGILLVEDMPSDTQLTHIALRELGIPNHIERVTSGEDALMLLRDRARGTPRFGIVLLDLKLVGMDGVSFLRAAKEEGLLNGIPVIVLTSSTLESDREAALAAGAVDVVEKAHDWDEWVRRVGDALRHHTGGTPTHP